MNALTMRIVETSSSATITVTLINSSKKIVKIWEDSNSWGAARWRVMLIREGKLLTFFQNPDQDFSRNIPTFRELAPGASIDQKLDLNGGNWCGLGGCTSYDERRMANQQISFRSQDIVIVAYDVPVSQEARDRGVWYGVIATTVKIQ